MLHNAPRCSCNAGIYPRAFRIVSAVYTLPNEGAACSGCPALKHCNWTMCLHSHPCMCLYACSSPPPTATSFPCSLARHLVLFHPLLYPRTLASNQASNSLSMRALTASRKNSATFRIRIRGESLSVAVYCWPFSLSLFAHFLQSLFVLALCQLGVVEQDILHMVFNSGIWPYLVVPLWYILLQELFYGIYHKTEECQHIIHYLGWHNVV